MERRLLESADACKMLAADILHWLQQLERRGSLDMEQCLPGTQTHMDEGRTEQRLKAYISDLETAVLIFMK